MMEKPFEIEAGNGTLNWLPSIPGENDSKEASNSPIPVARNDLNSAFASFLLFCGIGTAAIIGAYIRVGVSYFKIWRIETNYVCK